MIGLRCKLIYSSTKTLNKLYTERCKRSVYSLYAADDAKNSVWQRLYTIMILSKDRLPRKRTKPFYRIMFRWSEDTAEALDWKIMATTSKLSVRSLSIIYAPSGRTRIFTFKFLRPMVLIGSKCIFFPSYLRCSVASPSHRITLIPYGNGNLFVKL